MEVRDTDPPFLSPFPPSSVSCHVPGTGPFKQKWRLGSLLVRMELPPAQEVVEG